nr:MAG: hypothetical protein [Bacteriophage sp.]
MRNISQTIFNIDKMEKIIKTLPELKSIIDANKYHNEDMISQYSDTLESLEKYESDHRETELFSNLYISETINKL